MRHETRCRPCRAEVTLLSKSNSPITGTNGCRYCYANKDHRKALENYRRHNPSSPLLLGNILPTAIIKPARQTSLLDKEPKLF